MVQRDDIEFWDVRHLELGVLIWGIATLYFLAEVYIRARNGGQVNMDFFGSTATGLAVALVVVLLAVGLDFALTTYGLQQSQGVKNWLVRGVYIVSFAGIAYLLVSAV